MPLKEQSELFGADPSMIDPIVADQRIDWPIRRGKEFTMSVFASWSRIDGARSADS